MSRFVPAKAISLAAGVCAAALLAGCGTYNPFATAPVDPNSPIAAEVAAKARASRDYPSFADIPATPTDQRPLRAWGVAAREVAAAGEKLERDTAPETWTLNADETERFAARARVEAGPEADTRSSAAASEAFAREIRERATPPPPPR